ncbi:MAG: 3-ketoacyl-ACP reductase [Betaproteobacteria bacterium]|nr:3-ketoacyl-ACP reductase [Betaproteobacteria bacterium]
MKRQPVAFVTGGRRGIGRGIAYALAQNGFDVVVNDLVEDGDVAETLQGVAALGRKAKFVAGDISVIESHAALADAAWAAFGTVDCLVNNAGVQVKVLGDILDVTPQSFDHLIDVNLRGTFFLTQAVARRMLREARGPGDPSRCVVTISSVNANSIVSPNRAEYCISKSGLSMMNKLFAERLAASDILCYEVRPGLVYTDMTASSKERYDALIAEGISPMRRWGKTEDVGRTVAALATGLLPFTTGDALHVDGGLHMKLL